MLIAVPTINQEICLHFGHCDQFALVEVDEATSSIVQITYETPPPHEPGVLPRWLHEKGANVILAGGLGQRAQKLFAEQGIEVVVGVSSGAPEEIVRDYVNRSLVTSQNPCDH
ncbi:MAG: NifB/NifX family molybdenum-iron cluster-binding protein [Candidatus Hydrogenedentota bacterium]